MEIETLKVSHVRKNIIIGVVAVFIISAIVLNFTRAKYWTYVKFLDTFLWTNC